LTPSCTATHALVPGAGGTSETGPFLPLIEALILNVPFRSEMLSDLTALCAPWLSLYVKPLSASPDQNGWPLPLVPWLRTKRWLDGVPPFAKTCRMAPPALPAAVGSPTNVSLLFCSRALTSTFVGLPGLAVTENDLPRTV
jgi:hypothetical protein